MARNPIARIIALQQHRIDQIAAIGARMREQGPDARNQAIVQTRIRTVNENWSEINKEHAAIVLRADAARHEYITENAFNAMYRIYEDTIAVLFEAVNNIPNDNAERNPRRREREEDEPEARPAKLPRLELPTFSGKYEDWDSFADIFITLVHNAPRLADTTKLQYLKACLTGSAAELVKDVTIIGVNYASTWKMLQDRFHNPRLAVNRLLESFANIPHLKKESAVELREFVDQTQRIVRALSNLGMAVTHWDPWLVHQLEGKLDPESRKIWESELIIRDREMTATVPAEQRNDATRMPKFVDLAAFLERRAQSLSVIHAGKEEKKTNQPPQANHGTRRAHHAQTSQKDRPSTTARPGKFMRKCPLCPGKHAAGRCPTFIAKSAYDRVNDVYKFRLCKNCLGTGHRAANCPSRFSCKTCEDKHHSLLHGDERVKGPRPNPREDSIENVAQVRVNVARATTESRATSKGCNRARAADCPSVLATAQVVVIGPDNRETRARAMLDQGADVTLVSESLVQLLSLPRDRVDIELLGIGGCKAGKIKFATCLKLQSRIDPAFQIEVNALVKSQLTSDLPARDLVELDLEPFKKLALADPEFHRSDRIDIVIGVDLYGELLRSGVRRFRRTPLIAQNTALGWIISGPAQRHTPWRAARANHVKSSPSPNKIKALQCSVNKDLSELLQRFWNIEEVPSGDSKFKPEDEACEKLFADTHKRLPNGRFEVRLPVIRETPGVAAETRRMALGSLKHQHQRFARNPRLANAYTDFMDTYIQLGHMERVPQAEVRNARAWYLPHHAVVQDTPSQTKIRVVFDASRQTRDKHCLNDHLMAGPPLQSDLSLILLNWRRYRYAFTADIVKMFRQIRLAREDQDLHRILWSPRIEIPPQDYRLLTVTYGTKCAPYLAIRTLQQLARDEGSKFPLGAACLNANTYVDDTFAGADELATAVRKRDELVGILKSAGVELDKWAANHVDLLPPRARSGDNGAIKNIDSDKSVKTLGVHWHPTTDTFSFSIDGLEANAKSTKRSIYSDIARLFDPLGWLAPVTVIAKIIMQDLWLEKCEWDDVLNAEFLDRWQRYCHSLAALPTLSIDRWLGLSRRGAFEVHGFSDASSRAYAAAVYIRVDEGNGKYRAALLAAKTKPSPVKTVSIPKLELLGATLLVKLVCHLQRSELLQDADVHLWSDSQIVLMWLKKHPCHWKTFVANRVSLIQTELPSASWAHVPTKQNPADLATRGATPTELQTTDLWWHGPAWLASHSSDWPSNPTPRQMLHATSRVNGPEFLSRYSSLIRLTRITAWCLRPLWQFRRKRAGQDTYPDALTAAEFTHAKHALVKVAQAHAFPRELELLQARNALPKRHPLLKLAPFLDGDGILRVRGRLSNAKLPCHVQYPPILPRNSVLSRLFVLDAHQRALHGGPTLTSSILMRSVWIVGMRPLVKTIIHKCVMCQRHKPRLAHQLMGDLPAERVNPARPFTTTGLDYAGPFQIRTSKGRGQRAYKGYIALFVCFATKAIHLELVSDLTTATFIAAFRRFVSRRGICKQLFSDNATNYRGADSELRAMFHNASDFYRKISSCLAHDGTAWTFIPPTTPHYGGLWEAGVKSTKNLLKKTIGEHTLTFEEFSTVLAEIEACLNSRPLCPLTSDLDDLQALTPSHFLIGAPSGIIPDEATPVVPENRLDRFQLLQRIRDQFWKRWSNEYVVQLQERQKWRSPTDNITVGQLVLLKDDRYPASKWPLGRVLELHHGKDGLVRVVNVKTATNTLRRHIACLAPLHLDQHRDEDDDAKRGDQ